MECRKRETERGVEEKGKKEEQKEEMCYE